MINRILVSAAVLFAMSGSVMAEEPICVVIHQEGFIRNATPDEVRKATGNGPDHLVHGMIVPCELDFYQAARFYLEHGGH